MSFFRSYFQPGKAAVSQTAKEKQPLDNVGDPAPASSNRSIASSSGDDRYSRRSTYYPAGDFRNQTSDEIIDIKCDVMVNYLHQQQLESMWSTGGPGEGVVLKKLKDRFTCCPDDLSLYRGELFDAVSALNVKVAMTVNTRVIKLFLRRTDMPYVPLPDGLRLQILPDISHLPSCQKHHFAAFIQESTLLVVWDDDPRQILARIKNIESQLMRLIWEDEAPSADEKSVVQESVHPVGSINSSVEDLREPPRKLALMQAILTACTLTILIAAIGSGWRQVAQEIKIDGFMLRLAFAAIVPVQLWLALFFMQSIIGNLAQMIGPINQMNQNTKFYSGIRPIRYKRSTPLPHVTIQCPVYKEGLHSVIEPSIKSIKAAISTYEMQGGTANIFVNDDGMQLLSEEEANARKDFYDEHNIGWVARPKHNPKPKDGELMFIRGGKFKKASNMNYALAISNRVEDKLVATKRPDRWTTDEENLAYQRCLAEVLEEDEGRTWSEGNIRMGDYILLVDSDTRVPSDCFLDSVTEMEQSPRVAVIQFSSGVMNVTTSFFENGITFFTHLIYTAINYAVACGDVAPFVGHNAIIRWSAVQEVAYEVDGKPDMYWSESTVSEDFDMALRLQTAGYLIRFASYTGEGFKEGVSLTVYDELNRWEKYAYGCNELIFHPLRYWPTRGPFTKLFRNFMVSCMPLPAKLTIMAYIGTYYAIGSAWILTLANYLIIGWFNGYIDHYYIDSFRIFFSILVVFTALGNIALAVLRYRLNQQSLFHGMYENFKWVLLLAIFLGGLSLHVSQALLAHMFSVDMTWGATAKEVEDTTFFQEVPKLLTKFKGTFVFCFLLTGTLVANAFFVPPLWRIDTFVACFPVANLVASHFLLPIVLNPNLMLFKW